MTLALVGIVVVQSYWVRSALQLNEEQFDSSVKQAMNDAVADIEMQAAWRAYADFQSSIMPYMPPLPDTLIASIQASSSGYANKIVTDPFVSNLVQKTQPNAPNPKSKDAQTRQVYAFTKMLRKQLLSPYVLLSIEPKIMATRLADELNKRDIRLAGDLGIYSTHYRSFVGSFAAECPEDSTFLPREQYKRLLGEDAYRIPMFIDEDSRIAAGWLFVYFANKDRFIWRSVWSTLLLSMLFTGIILFCFVYTIRVIFQQKKLSEIINVFIEIS